MPCSQRGATHEQGTRQSSTCQSSMLKGRARKAAPTTRLMAEHAIQALTLVLQHLLASWQGLPPFKTPQINSAWGRACMRSAGLRRGYRERRVAPP